MQKGAYTLVLSTFFVFALYFALHSQVQANTIANNTLANITSTTNTIDVAGADDSATYELERQYGVGYNLSAQGRHEEALEIMLELTEYKHPAATQNVALSYYHGLGVEKNKKLAEKYFFKAHMLGILDATNELANIYHQRKNNKKALDFWTLASNQGDEYATYNLGLFYIEQNKKIAKEYLIKAKQLGHPFAQELLEYLQL